MISTLHKFTYKKLVVGP